MTEAEPAIAGNYDVVRLSWLSKKLERQEDGLNGFNGSDGLIQGLATRGLTMGIVKKLMAKTTAEYERFWI